jgi:hypothetical protein
MILAGATEALAHVGSATGRLHYFSSFSSSLRA